MLYVITMWSGVVLGAAACLKVIQLIVLDGEPCEAKRIDQEDRTVQQRINAGYDVEPTPADEPDDADRPGSPADLRDRAALEAGNRTDSWSVLAAHGEVRPLPGYGRPPAIDGTVAPRSHRKPGPLAAVLDWVRDHSQPIPEREGWEDGHLDELHLMRDEPRWEPVLAGPDPVAVIDQEPDEPVEDNGDENGDEPYDDEDFPVEAPAAANVQRALYQPTSVFTIRDEPDEQKADAAAFAALSEKTGLNPLVRQTGPWDHTGFTAPLPKLNDELLAAMDETNARDAVAA